MTGKRKAQLQPGIYLRPEDREQIGRQQQNSRRLRRRRYLTVTVLLAWDGLLLYMIVHCLIDRIYGAVFIAVLSVYTGYKMK